MGFECVNKQRRVEMRRKNIKNPYKREELNLCPHRCHIWQAPSILHPLVLSQKRFRTLCITRIHLLLDLPQTYSDSAPRKPCTVG
jgi:hypothetical protein